MWEHDHRLPEVIMRAWDRARPKGDLGEVAASLKAVMDDLRKWSKVNFVHVEKQINSLRQELETLQLTSGDRLLIRQ